MLNILCAKKIIPVFTLIIAFSLVDASSVPAQNNMEKFLELERKFSELFQGGKYSEALPYARQILEIYEKALGPGLPLGSLYSSRGRRF